MKSSLFPAFTNFWTVKRKILFIIAWLFAFMFMEIVSMGWISLQGFADLNMPFSNIKFFYWTLAEYIARFQIKPFSVMLVLPTIFFCLWWKRSNILLFSCLVALGALYMEFYIHEGKYAGPEGYASISREYLPQIPFWLKMIFYR